MNKCNLPPAGWRCSREAGHKGPCAATLALSFEPVADQLAEALRFVLEECPHKIVEYDDGPDETLADYIQRALAAYKEAKNK